ncbi:hypothetical protein PBI_SCTP2_512 [Salicola phage SCTP-2]|nr:hypothetical protein PBI_SCTP2_512 [Salicola phage SCTP-2]
MTNETTTQTQTATRRGRPLSTKGRKARNAVLKALNSEQGAQGVTAKDIARQGKMSATAVRNRLNALERAGEVVKVGVRNTDGRGRPQAVYVKA